MSIRKFLVISIVSFLVLAGIIILLFFSTVKKGKEGISPFPPTITQYYIPGEPSPAITLPTVVITIYPADRVIISGVTVKNFFKTAEEITPYGDVVIVNKPEYRILYQANFNQFLVNILSSPFEGVKAQAEKEFLRILDVTALQACSLNVIIATPRFANPDEAGREYGLSFCKG